MKKIITIILVLCGCSSPKVNYFVEIKLGNCSENSEKYKKIVLKNFSNEMCFYNVKNFDSYSNHDKIKIIEELLGFEGNTELCSVEIKNYNILSSQIYTGDIMRYTIQLEALFLINQIFFDSPFIFSPMPILYNKKTKKVILGTEKEMVDIFKLYNNWFVQLKNNGFESMKLRNARPLKNSDFSWYSSAG